MSQRITDLGDDRVMVQIKSKRGTGTRDQDAVMVRGIYEDIEEAEEESPRLNELLKDRMREARELSTDETGTGGTKTSDGVSGDSDASQESKATDTTRRSDPSRSADISKVYLGEGAETSGWVPVETGLVEEEIVPLVETYETDREDIETISVNFSSDISASGWTQVDAGIVTRSIQPLVQEHRLDTS